MWVAILGSTMLGSHLQVPCRYCAPGAGRTRPLRRSGTFSSPGHTRARRALRSVPFAPVGWLELPGPGPLSRPPRRHIELYFMELFAHLGPVGDVEEGGFQSRGSLADRGNREQRGQRQCGEPRGNHRAQTSVSKRFVLVCACGRTGQSTRATWRCTFFSFTGPRPEPPQRPLIGFHTIPSPRKLASHVRAQRRKQRGQLLLQRHRRRAAAGRPADQLESHALCGRVRQRCNAHGRHVSTADRAGRRLVALRCARGRGAGGGPNRRRAVARAGTGAGAATPALL